MTRIPSLRRATLTGMILLIAGCDSAREDRYERLVQQALRDQTEQNKRLGEQSQQVAEASRRLVEGDAEARTELLEAQKLLTSELHSERANLDRQKEDLERERQSIAAARQRDPIIAQAITALGLTLACLLPLVLAAYIVWAATNNQDSEHSLGELLVMELASEDPLLLPSSEKPALASLEHQSATNGKEPTDNSVDAV